MKKYILATLGMLSILSSMAIITEEEFLRDCHQRMKDLSEKTRTSQCERQYRRFLNWMERAYRDATEEDLKNVPLQKELEEACLKLVIGIQMNPTKQPSALTKYY